MILKEAILQVLKENRDFVDPNTDFSVNVRQGGIGGSKYIQSLIGSFKNERDEPVECTFGYVNDYSIELTISVNSERINSKNGMFKTLTTSGEFFRRLLGGLLNREPKNRKVRLIYFLNDNKYGNSDDIAYSLFRQFIAPKITQVLNTKAVKGDTWEEVGTTSAGLNKEAYLWRNTTDIRTDPTNHARKYRPGMDVPYGYENKRPNVSDKGIKTFSFDELSPEDEEYKRRLFSRESIEFAKRIQKQLYEDLMRKTYY